MKFLIVLLLCCTFILFSTTKVFSQSDCYDLDPNVTCGNWSQEKTLNFYYEYNPCPIEVVYITRTCTDNSCTPPRQIFQGRVLRFGWDWDDYNCIALLTILFPGYPNDFSDLRIDVLNDMIRKTQNEISNNLLIDFYLSLNEEQKKIYRCPNYPQCSSPTNAPCKNFEVNFINAKCQSICQNSPDATHGNRFTIRFSPCLSNPIACCTYKKMMCVCIEDGREVMYFYQETNTQEGTCEPDPSNEEMCPDEEGWIYHPCYPFCPN